MIEIAEKNGIFDNLSKIFNDMDSAYDKSASESGFSCNGCDESCCKTRFHHFAWSEYLYFLKGLESVASDRIQIEDRARFVADIYNMTRQTEPPGIMCPVNRDGLCMVYGFRPMICRLHGIAHEFRLPSGEIRQGTGCAVFDRVSEGKFSYAMDRTPFYSRLAALEKSTREILGQPGKIKMTVADMIVSICAHNGR